MPTEKKRAAFYGETDLLAVPHDVLRHLALVGLGDLVQEVHGVALLQDGVATEKTHNL